MSRWIETKSGRIDKNMLRTEFVEAHEYVTKIKEIRDDLNKRMQEAKELETSLTEAYLAKKAASAGLEQWNGFAVDYDIDKDVKVETQFSEIVGINTSVSAGIQKISDWVDNLQPNLNRKIRTILKDVLSVKASGSISKSQLQKLCSYGFEDQEYKDGVEMITSNMQVIDKKSYTQVSIRNEEEEEGGKVVTSWNKINVNYAGM